MAKPKQPAPVTPKPLIDKATCMGLTLAMQSMFRRVAAGAMPGAAAVGEWRRPAATESEGYIETSYVFRWGADADRAMLADLAKIALGNCDQPGQTVRPSIEVTPITEPDFCVTMSWKKK